MDKIKFHNIHEILAILGEKAQSDELHIQNLNREFLENPISYPFRSDNTAILLLLEGEIKVKVNLEMIDLKQNDLIIFTPDTFTHILNVSKKINCIVVTFTEEYAISNLKNYNDINILRLLAERVSSMVSLDKGQISNIKRIAENLLRVNTKRDEIYSKERLYHYFNILSLEIMVLFSSKQKELNIQTSRQKELIQKFLNQLTVNIQISRSVKFYSDQLFITPGYLSKILKEASGMSAREIIEEAVIIEARNLLQNTDKSIGQIAEELNFSDQSFFGKFFKKKMKVSPKDFRNQTK